MTVSFKVLGEPVGKGRPKFARVGDGVTTYTPRETRAYEERVRTDYRAAGGPHLGDRALVCEGFDAARAAILEYLEDDET